MKRTATLSEKLKSYSILSGSMLASVFAADGQIVYTDIIPDDTLGGFIPDTLPRMFLDSIDLNNDGTFDFQLRLMDFDTNPDDAGISFFETVNGDFDVQNNKIFYYDVQGYARIAFKFFCGNTFPAFGTFSGTHYANFNSHFGTVKHYYWQNIHDAYLGLKIKISGNVHYGWIHLDVNTMDTIPVIIVKDYAYEATAGKKIPTCDSGLVSTIDIVSQQNQISIFPNPSDGNCIVKLAKPLTGEIELLVTDALGTEVYGTRVSMSSRNELSLDFSGLSAGVYFIQLKSKETSLTEKWIRK